jgi:hypothetical protein
MADFLLEQRKGPVQYLLTYAIQLAHPSLSNQLLTRLPFALAGILGVYFLYRLGALLNGRKIGLIAGFFLSLNGLFIGLSRIVQYQAIVILFSILTHTPFRWQSTTSASGTPAFTPVLPVGRLPSWPITTASSSPRLPSTCFRVGLPRTGSYRQGSAGSVCSSPPPCSP